MSTDDLILRLRETARRDPNTIWYDVVSAEKVAFVEAALELTFPPILGRCFQEISNGGFGSGYQLTGLPGGHESSWGNLLQTAAVLRKDDECEEDWLPIIDWGCAAFTIVECGDGNSIVTLYEGDCHREDDTLEDLLHRWTQGFVPELHSGEFRHAKPE